MSRVSSKQDFDSVAGSGSVEGKDHDGAADGIGNAWHCLTSNLFNFFLGGGQVMITYMYILYQQFDPSPATAAVVLHGCITLNRLIQFDQSFTWCLLSSVWTGECHGFEAKTNGSVASDFGKDLVGKGFDRRIHGETKPPKATDFCCECAQ